MNDRTNPVSRNNDIPSPPGGMHRRRFVLSVAALTGALAAGRAFWPVFAAAQTGATPTVDPNFMLAAPEPDPQRGGTLRVAFNGATANYDLYQGGSFPVLCHIYNGLVRENLADGLKTIVPDLATSWETSADGLTHTFTLREGVTFHDGSPFSADDVVATFDRVINPPEGTAIIIRDRFPVLTAVEAVDPQTVKFTLSEPQATFLQLLTDPGIVIYSKKTLDENKGDLRKVVAPGTGPFTYVNYTEGEKWEYAKNANYWNPNTPYIDNLEVLHIPAWPDRGAAVLTDQADLSWNVGKDTFDEGANRPDTFSTHPNAAFGAYCVVINNTVEPFTDPRVRRAVHLVLDRPALIQVFARQEQINLSRWIPRTDQYATPLDVIQTMPGYRADKTEDIAEAKRLLAEAGYPDGIPNVDFLCASVAGHADLLGPAIQDQLLRAVGIQTQIRTQERALLVEDEKSGKFTFVLDTIGSPISDFSPLANQYLKTKGSSNFTGFSNAEFDELLEKSNQELDSDARRAMLDQMQDLLDEQSPLAMIGYTDQRVMWNNRVMGLALMERDHWENGRVETAWIKTS